MIQLSIITVVLNDKRHIEYTINTVLSQTYKSMEYIIIDGGSTDGTKEVIQKYNERIKWISGPDKGIYDAMMKGVQLAQGEWVLFLNSGDYLENNTVLEGIFDNYKDHGESFLIGNAIFFKEWGTFKARPSILSKHWYDAMPVIHPSTIIRRSLQLKYPFHMEYKFSADYMFFVEVLKEEGTYKYFDVTISCVNLQEGATATHWVKSLKDDLDILKRMEAPEESIKKVKRSLFRNYFKNILLALLPSFKKFFIRNEIQWGGWNPTSEPYENRFLAKADPLLLS